MLNLSQRLILGCVLLACLTLGLVAITHHALAAAGQTNLAFGFILAALIVELGTIYFVLRPIRMLARDAHRIAQGNLDLEIPARERRDEIGEMARSVAVPTTVGFCLYVRRAALDQIGGFDAEAFGRGYGEENDFCMR